MGLKIVKLHELHAVTAWLLFMLLVRINRLRCVCLNAHDTGACCSNHVWLVPFCRAKVVMDRQGIKRLEVMDSLHLLSSRTGSSRTKGEARRVTKQSTSASAATAESNHVCCLV